MKIKLLNFNYTKYFPWYSKQIDKNKQLFLFFPAPRHLPNYMPNKEGTWIPKWFLFPVAFSSSLGFNNVKWVLSHKKKEKLTEGSSPSLISCGLYRTGGKDADALNSCWLSCFWAKRLMIDSPRSQIACEFWKYNLHQSTVREVQFFPLICLLLFSSFSYFM